MSGFLRTWLAGYYNPARFAELMRDRPAPRWGLYAALIRGLLDALLLYLPAALRGARPWPESFIRLLPNEHYFWHLVWIAPPFFLFSWLYIGAVTHAAIRLVGRRSDMDTLLNLGGMAALVVGAFLVVLDVAWVAAGLRSQVALGLIHLACAVWAMVLGIVGMKRLLGVPVWLAVLLSILTAVVGYPFNMLIMRAPF